MRLPALCVLGVLLSVAMAMGMASPDLPLVPTTDTSLVQLETVSESEASAKPVCMLIHGLWPLPQLNKGIRDSWEFYWGNTAVLNSKCQVKVFVTDTKTRAWDDMSLLQEVCAAISQVKANIVFSHSMGNNIMAAAIRLGVPGCKEIIPKGATLTPTSRLWMSMQGPMTGSPAADSCKIFCSNKNVKVLLDPATVFARSYCSCLWDNPLKPATMGVGVSSLFSTYQPKRAELKQPSPVKTLRQFASRILCGVGAKGVKTAAPGSALVAVAEVFKLHGVSWGADDNSKLQVSPNPRGNDVLVPFQGCSGHLDGQPDLVFKPDPSADYYIAQANHASGRGSDGDGANPDQKPVAWMLASVDYYTKLLNGRPAV